MRNSANSICNQLLATVALFTLACPIAAQTKSSSLNDASVLALMQRELIPGLALAVIDGENTAVKTYGVRKNGEPEPVNDRTMFESGSLTKPVTAFVAMRMQSDGLLDLDRPLADYVDYEAIAHDERHRVITARMVLSHTTGMPNARAADGLQIYLNPGESYGYSGEAFRYLQAALESISGKTLDALAIDYVFNPLEMSNSSYVWRDAFLGNRAAGHTQEGEFAREMHQLNRAFAEGGLATTIEDYSKFAAYVLQQHREGNRVVVEMLSPAVPVKGFHLGGQISWGLGWGLEVADDNVRVWHTGSNGAFKSFVVLDLEQNRAVVCFLNGANGLNIISEIVGLTLGERSLAEQYQPTIRESVLYRAAN